MKCLIIASGNGSQLQKKDDTNHLIPILGVPLIERVIRSAIEAGADDFYVVTGYKGERISAFLGHIAGHLGVPITAICHENLEKENDLLLLKAREYLREPFLLLMADHLFDPSIVRELEKIPLADGEIILGVDGDTQNSLVNIENSIRVSTGNGKIRDIGKDLTDFNGIDTGVFLCTPGIFAALERSTEENGKATLSGVVKTLVGDGCARAVDVSGHFWIDVADPSAFKRAENALMATLRGKPDEGPVFRYFYRPLSGMISRRLVNYKITPNQISVFSFLCSILAAGLFALGGYPALLAGGLMAQFAMVIDCCDGAIARLKFQISEYGGWFDAVLDRYADAFLLFGLTWHAYAVKTEGYILFTGFLAIIGSFVLSYTADKYDSLMRDRIRRSKEFRVGRELRVFLIFLGAIFNQVFLTLLVIAIVMNIEIIRRIIICRDNE